MRAMSFIAVAAPASPRQTAVTADSATTSPFVARTFGLCRYTELHSRVEDGSNATKLFDRSRCKVAHTISATLDGDSSHVTWSRNACPLQPEAWKAAA